MDNSVEEYILNQKISKAHQEYALSLWQQLQSKVKNIPLPVVEVSEEHIVFTWRRDYSFRHYGFLDLEIYPDYFEWFYKEAKISGDPIYVKDASEDECLTEFPERFIKYLEKISSFRDEKFICKIEELKTKVHKRLKEKIEYNKKHSIKTKLNEEELKVLVEGQEWLETI